MATDRNNLVTELIHHATSIKFQIRPGSPPPLPLYFSAPIRKHDRYASRSAFSLLELLVVIAIIAILASGLAVGLGGNKGASLKSAANLLSSQFQAVRTSAILNNAPARLLIDKSTDATNSCRRIAVVRQISDAVGSITWERTGPTVRLPEGAFVVLDGEIPRCTKASGDTGPDEMVHDGVRWAFYEFSSTGACEKNAGARIILAAGFNAGAGWAQPNEKLIQGLFLTRIGEAVFFEDPEQIKSSFLTSP